MSHHLLLGWQPEGISSKLYREEAALGFHLPDDSAYSKLHNCRSED